MVVVPLSLLFYRLCFLLCSILLLWLFMRECWWSGEFNKCKATYIKFWLMWIPAIFTDCFLIVQCVMSYMTHVSTSHPPTDTPPSTPCSLCSPWLWMRMCLLTLHSCTLNSTRSWWRDAHSHSRLSSSGCSSLSIKVSGVVITFVCTSYQVAVSTPLITSTSLDL